MPLFECIPNVSEGRRASVVAACADAIERALGSDGALLHQTADPDHDRSVFTFAGSGPAIVRAIGALYDAALPHVDLRRQRGVHPRIGAVDVVPIVSLDPLEGRDSDETARSAALELAERCADEAACRGVPVVFYGDSATAQSRRDLAAVRRGGLSALGERLSSGIWRSDAGPAAPHPMAGVSAIGVRDLLVAYNVFLDTADPRPARRIARRVRESSGGLPAVKALGLFLESAGRAQVSMNLVDTERTSLYQAFDAVVAEADRLGVGVAASELIGLVPRRALRGDDPARLRWLEFGPDRVLETRLEQAGLLEARAGDSG